MVCLQHVALPGEPLRLAGGERRDLALVLLLQLAPRPGLDRRDPLALLLPDALLDRLVLPPRDRLATERAFLRAFHRRPSQSLPVPVAWTVCRAYQSRMRASWPRRRA